MTTKQPETAQELRQRAEELFKARETVIPATLSPEEIKRLFHELTVHQIELEMQNEELRCAQTELDASKARYFDLYDLAPVGYVTISAKNLIQEVNLAAATMFGVARSALVNEGVRRLLPKEGQLIFYQHVEQCIKSDTPQKWEMRLVRADGELFWAHLRVTPGKNGECWLVINDITERKQTEETLQGSEARYRTLTQSANDAIITIDRDSAIVGWNLSAERIFGYSEIEVFGQQLTMIMPSRFQEGHDKGFKRVHEGGEPHVIGKTIEVIGLRKDGSEFPLELSLSRWEIPTGRFYTGIMRDISVRKRIEKENLKLEGQLQQAQKIESIGQLAGGVAHDFNNMLGVILGHAELALRKADSSSPLVSDLQEIRTAANRSADLTRQLLTFARKQIIIPKVLDLNESVAGTLKMLQRLIGENIQLSWNPVANLWPVKVDPSQLDQILANLCVNARDAIDGVGKITIKTKNTSWDETTMASRPYDVVPGEYVLLSVSDDGCGMDKETQAHIFEPFYTTKEVGSGTGLGLATVYGAIKQNRGFFTVYSEPGVGTVFNIYLPREKDTVQVVAETAEKALRCGTETILLVEDDEMLLNMEISMLEESGYTVLAAITADLAQSLAKEHPGPIHLLMSDMIMPEMNGKELSAKLQPLRPEMKVLFLSGYTSEIISNQGIIDEGIHFLQKPFSFEELTNKVREVLDNH